MRVGGKPMRTLWTTDGDRSVTIIDQTVLPHDLRTLAVRDVAAMAHAIRSMQVRGAPLIGVAGCYGVALAMLADSSDRALDAAAAQLCETRPTAVNLKARVDEIVALLRPVAPGERARHAFVFASRITEDEVSISERIADHGKALIEAAFVKKGRKGRVNVLTHCNAGWLATVDWGTALAPIYRAHDAGIPVHVWVDETRPRNQGYLTAWELQQHGVPYTVLVDNAGGHVMQHGDVDLCIVGTDRTTANGDVCNKVGTYLKALAAKDNGVPFYVAAPGSSIDFAIDDGVKGVPIEERSGEEVHDVVGRDAAGKIATVRVTPDGATVANYAFDVTPARLVTGIITERGVCAATTEGLRALYPERAG